MDTSDCMHIAGSSRHSSCRMLSEHSNQTHRYPHSHLCHYCRHHRSSGRECRLQDSQDRTSRLHRRCTRRRQRRRPRGSPPPWSRHGGGFHRIRRPTLGTLACSSCPRRRAAMGQEASGNRTNDTWRPFSRSKVPKRITRVPLESRKLQKNSSICFGGSGEALLLFPFLCHFVNGTSMECYIKIAASFNGGGFVVEISSGHATLAIQDGDTRTV